MAQASNPPNPVRDVIIVGGGGSAIPSASAVPVTNASVGAGTNRSATVTSSAANLAAANTSRVGFIVKNDSAVDIYINFVAAATNALGVGNLKIAANGGYWESPAWGCPTGAVSAISTGASVAITAVEF